MEGPGGGERGGAAAADKAGTTNQPEPASSCKTRKILGGKFVFKEGSSKVVICRECKVEFAYHHSTSSLSYHYRCKHPLSGKAVKAAGEDDKKPSKKYVQPPLTLFTTKVLTRDKEESITNALAFWVAQSGRPPRMVEDPGLQRLLGIALDNGEYQTPSRQTITRRVEGIHEAARARVESALAKATNVALTIDYWTSRANEGYLGVMSHHIDDNCQIVNKTLGVVHSVMRHSQEQIAQEIEGVCDSWGVRQKVTTIGTDNASNMLAAMRILNEFQVLPCAAHSLQLSVNKAIKASGLDNTVAKARKIVGHIKHSAANLRELKAKQVECKEPERALVSYE